MLNSSKACRVVVLSLTLLIVFSSRQGGELGKDANVLTTEAPPLRNSTLLDDVALTPFRHTGVPQPLKCRVRQDLVPEPAFDASSFCNAIGLKARHTPVRVFYGVMFSFELDMLEVLLHETFPLIEKYIIVEAAVSHSKKEKELVLPSVFQEKRFDSFKDRVINGTFLPRPGKKIRSGWEIERKQRQEVLRIAFEQAGMRDDDLLIANMDLDEIFSRETILRFKYCDSESFEFYVYSFRYNLNCLAEPQAALLPSMVFRKKEGFVDLYRRRTVRTHVDIDLRHLPDEMRVRKTQLVWHLSTFGNISQIRRKLANSPHRFVDEVGDEEIAADVNNCRFNGRKRTLLGGSNGLTTDVLPRFVARNKCHFMEKKWFV